MPLTLRICTVSSSESRLASLVHATIMLIVVAGLELYPVNHVSLLKVVNMTWPIVLAAGAFMVRKYVMLTAAHLDSEKTAWNRSPISQRRVRRVGGQGSGTGGPRAGVQAPGARRSNDESRVRGRSKLQPGPGRIHADQWVLASTPPAATSSHPPCPSGPRRTRTPGGAGSRGGAAGWGEWGGGGGAERIRPSGRRPH